MSDRILTFNYEQEYGPDSDSSYSWWAREEWLDEPVGLCNGDLRKYVGLPDGCKSFDAVFSLDEPGVDSFAITYDDERGTYNIDTLYEMDFYSGVTGFLAGMYDDGYQYFRVEFPA